LRFEGTKSLVPKRGKSPIAGFGDSDALSSGLDYSIGRNGRRDPDSKQVPQVKLWPAMRTRNLKIGNKVEVLLRLDTLVDAERDFPPQSPREATGSRSVKTPGRHEGGTRNNRKDIAARIGGKL
jgi:hypothetical protein